MWFFLVFLFVILAIVSYHFWRLPSIPLREPNDYLKPSEWSDDQVTIGWIGHSTVLINFYGKWILTDPVMVKRVGVHLFGSLSIGVRRHVLPAIRWEDIPTIDYLFLSHAHMDHFDIPTLRRLANPHTTVVTSKNTSQLLKGISFQQVLELENKETLDLNGELQVQAVPVRHWGNRYPWNIRYGYTGYLLERKGRRIFFPGDTAYTPDFKWLRQVGEIDVCLMPIGAYSPNTYQRNHCTPEQAWEMYQHTGAKYLIPIHWNTFVLSKEPIEEPIQRLKKIADAEQDRIVIDDHGQTFQLD